MELTTQQTLREQLSDHNGEFVEGWIKFDDETGSAELSDEAASVEVCKDINGVERVFVTFHGPGLHGDEPFDTVEEAYERLHGLGYEFLDVDYKDY